MRGFTLVEAIVASAIAVVVGVVMLTILQMNNQGVSNGALNARIQMQYETVVAQISRDARFANVVLDGTTSESCPLAAGAVPKAGITAVKMFDDDCHWIAGYQIVGTTLQEYVTTTNAWINFRVGPNEVTVTPASSFSLTADRKWLTLNIAVFSSFASLKDTAVSKKEVFVCKN